MITTEIKFMRDKTKQSFKIRHNLDEMKLSIDAAFVNWEFRTSEFTVESFCEYIKSKDPMFIKATPVK